MKKYFTFCLLTLLQFWVRGQNVVQGECFIDTDAGYGQNSPVAFTPSADGTFSFTANLSTIAPGFHKLYVRTKDSNGKWGLTTRRNIEVMPALATLKIVGGEYFFNSDPGVGAANPISISPQDSVILQNFNAVVNTLAAGYHKLYGRFRDANGNWSQSFRRNIEVYKNTNNAAIFVEYFFDTDAGVGNCASIAFPNPQADGTFAFNISAGQIPTGADTLFIRVKDSSNGKWSLTRYWPNPFPFPLTLLSFGATMQNNLVSLDWKTDNEVNTSHFNITRSTDAVRFTQIGKVAARGNTNEQTGYTYTDDIANLKSGKVYYRLEMVDKDGKFTYSNTAVVNIADKKAQFLMMPNPAHNYFTIISTGFVNDGNTIITISDLSGRKLIQQNFSATGGQRVDVTSFAKGSYLVTINNRGNVQTQKLLIE